MINSKLVMGYVVGVLDFRLKYIGMSSGWSFCVMLLCKTFYFLILVYVINDGWKCLMELYFIYVVK